MHSGILAVIVPEQNFKLNQLERGRKAVTVKRLLPRDVTHSNTHTHKVLLPKIQLATINFHVTLILFPGEGICLSLAANWVFFSFLVEH
jgi:hypothetical protein